MHEGYQPRGQLYSLGRGVEKEGGKRGGRTCLCSLLVFYEGLALTQLAKPGHDVVEVSLRCPLGRPLVGTPANCLGLPGHTGEK